MGPAGSEGVEEIVLVLGLDCSTKATAAALVQSGRVLAESFLHVERPQSERLVPVLNAMLQHANLAWSQVDAFAVALGPGSFTGLRVALATIKGLAHPAGKLPGRRVKPQPLG